MIVAEGGKLLYPKPTYANSATPKMYPGSWSSVGQRFVEPKTFPKWTVLKLGKVAFGFAQYTPFKKAFLEGGMTFEPPEGSPNVHHVQDPEDVGQLRAKFEELASINIRLLLVILPSAEPSVYANLKFLGDVKYGPSTQVNFFFSTTKFADLDPKGFIPSVSKTRNFMTRRHHQNTTQI